MATAPATFSWGANGRKITSPEQAARQRLIAEALMASGLSPAQNIGQGLADVTGALTGSVLNNEVMAAEEAGALEASGLFQGLGSSSPEADIIAALSNPWASDSQSSVAQALLGQQFQANDPMNQLRLAQAQFDYDQDLSGVGTAVEAPASVREWEYFNTLDPEQQSQYLIMKRSNPYLDLATGFAQPDPVNPGQTLGDVIPKDIRGKEAQQAIGAAEGAAIAGAPGDIAAGETALDLINQIKTHPELPNATGFTSFANAIPGTPRYGFQNLVEQAKSGAFLTAIQEMRGLGSLSNAEGQTATAAVTRMNTALDKNDFLKAVADYEAIIQRGVDRARSKLAPPVGASNPNAVVVDGFTIEAID